MHHRGLISESERRLIRSDGFPGLAGSFQAHRQMKMRLGIEMEQADGFQRLLDGALPLPLCKMGTAARPSSAAGLSGFGREGLPEGGRCFRPALTLKKCAANLVAKERVRDAVSTGGFDMAEGLGLVSFCKSQVRQQELHLGRTLGFRSGRFQQGAGFLAVAAKLIWQRAKVRTYHSLSGFSTANSRSNGTAWAIRGVSINARTRWVLL